MITIKSRPIPVTQYLDVIDEDQVAKSISYRKGLFDSGAEKIQSIIDQNSQLPSLTTEDDIYIKSKISEITNNINSIPGLDLSNSFNINTLTKTVNAVKEDPIIQASVSSALNHQKNIKFLEDAKQNPKKYGDVISVQNEDDYYTQLAKYKQDRANGINTVFSYQYKPYKDVGAILSKEMEKVKADMTKDIAGNYFLKNEYIHPDKIKQIALDRIKSDPSLSEQIRINSRFSTKGLPDEYLIQYKNKLQQSELINRKIQAEKELSKLYTLDFKDPKELSEKLNKVKNKITNYENYQKSLLSNPNRLIDIDTGIEINTPSRETLAYEMTALALLGNLADKFSYSKKEYSPNPIPLKEQELNWNVNMDKLEFRFKQDQEKYRREKDALDRQVEMLKLDSKVKVSEDNNGQLSFSLAYQVSIDDNPSETIDLNIKDSKLRVRKTLNDAITKVFNDLNTLSGTGPNQQYLTKFIDSMIDDNNNIINLAEDENIKRYQSLSKASTGTSPEARLIREALKKVNRISLDVKNIWSGDKTVSLENLELLKNVTDEIHNIGSLQSSKEYALQAGLKEAGITKEQYNNLLNDKKVKEKVVAYVTMDGRVNYQEMNQDNKKILEKVNQGINNYYTKRNSFTKLYPIVNFNPKDDSYYIVKNDIHRYITEGSGISIDGKTDFSNVYGKENKWKQTGFTNNAEIFPIDYNPKTGYVKVRIKEGDKEIVDKFPVNQELMKRYIPSNINESLRPMNYSDQLNMSDNGELKFLDKKGNIKPQWKTTVSEIPLRWRAVKVNPSNVNDNSVKVQIDLPYNGVNVPKQLDIVFPSAEDAEKFLTSKMRDDFRKLKSNNLSIQEIKSLMLNNLRND